MPQVLRIQHLLRLEDCIHAFHWDDERAPQFEDERGVLTIADHNVDLVAECPSTVHHVRLDGEIALWKVPVEQVDPNALTCITKIGWVSKGDPGALEFTCDLVIQLFQQCRK